MLIEWMILSEYPGFVFDICTLNCIKTEYYSGFLSIVLLLGVF